jgi:ABC-type spermidine/putrescine transport system permease subunit II
MSRLLLVPVAVLTWMGGLFLLVLSLAALSHNWSGLLPGAALAPSLRDAATSAALVTALALPAGLGAALAFRRTGKAARYTATGLALLLLIAPPPPFSAVVFLHDPASRAAVLPLAAAVARGAALIMVLLLAGLRAVPPGLQRAAMLAGARPSQAWRHAVLAPLLTFLAASIVAAFALTVATGPLALAVAPHLATGSLWTVPACLLLAAAGLAALAGLFLIRREA